ncbi:poly-beta-hydroxybutyrate polymerase [Agaricicola taiwanensis]|uniref:Poly-beta-hydroxybutyrate polymerase n=1 Tax=Agaricicola taiwanensis TaxID=591372 RepID=A0A8J3DU02_9RHOB|nr:class I poly(R)-hydroxyalkanoic acid synthase [Agaricicola taiwanensis]GGE45081.1 poly-beta-hydroxybutyrate polymerase [Agaricicola taiwanensis]
MATDESGGKVPPEPDYDVFAKNMARLVEEGGKAMAAYVRPRETGENNNSLSDGVADVVKTLGQVAETWLSDPHKTLDAQRSLVSGYFDLWSSTLRKMNGEEVAPVVEPESRDARFQDPDWSTNPFFDFLKQAYLHTTRWAETMVNEAEGIDERTRAKAHFYVRQIGSAVAPSNFVLTNPELIKETMAQKGENLVRGMQMLAEDIAAGRGELKIRQTDRASFEVGVNLATTPGQVIFQNDLIQLIQYEPTTPQVRRRPLLIVPPWINKFYVLDLTPEKSFIRWAVNSGLTVFVISWVNPDARHALKGFDSYMQEGVLAALDVVLKTTRLKQADLVGYCVGGTLLAATLAYMAATGDKRAASATFLTTQVDFTHSGDLQCFVDENQLKSLERKINEAGFLEGSHMSSAFNMLRPNDLIWSYVVSNYLKGRQPRPFDLLHWNSDSTRMAAANHLFYLKNCYDQNMLARGLMEIAGVQLDIGKVTVPVYELATREDHIAPAKSAFLGATLFGGPVRFVLSGSGHIAGVINPPERNKYQYWTGPAPKGSYDAWLNKAKEHPGSWWPDWRKWLADLDEAQGAPPKIGGGRYKSLEPAPGSYVKVPA